MINITKDDGTNPEFGMGTVFGITKERAAELCELFNNIDSQKNSLDLDGSILIDDFCKGATNEQEQAFCILQAGIRWEFLIRQQYEHQFGMI